ncbi:WYL domain-containing protein [Paenibacillus soyae]|uniref:WYL domain-containing protein n=1 Tax=Paenibacillus soyae TaxID=2969249 RepID=A0A9X2MPL7_9BACL|nr:WYL domain-containing protein [Paenibacillus soyae]MCR2804115.1 WYL domain-containing protein [Paenibacillus soyae]
MNPFEKIFNYQIISRLEETGSYALTSQERSWLKAMLEREAAEPAFEKSTREKLREMLHEEEDYRLQEIIIERGRSEVRQIYHPLLRQLRRSIADGKGIRMSIALKHGGVRSRQSGIPFKLEYSMVKREWYLLWYETRRRALMSTRLRNIISLEEWEPSRQRTAEAKAWLARALAQRVRSAEVEVVKGYNAELSRILSAFSCFDKSVSFDEDSGIYRIRIQYLGDESEFLLSRIRFLGLRVRIVEGEYMKRRMLESATKTLRRYGELEESAPVASADEADKRLSAQEAEGSTSSSPADGGGVH